MDVGTVSSEDVIESYRRQLTAASERIALLEAALARMQRSALERETAAKMIRDDPTGGGVDPT
ncbi:hypothetical protein SEA_SATIS_64 [Streptomyces phage Satis]|nr:hypothetical protein SEA_SATIS_64 [Streptomyces phage Satis]QBZ71962.1 hypothetical protein SEA_KRADAL_64 [Streptomyces phage Kradal]QPL14381.1 hypothetical protein SEA_EHYELIMAYOE_64 [Streptomyces phage EhyElimayoE]